jgi:DNA polymerase epsilon subunit 2
MHVIRRASNPLSVSGSADSRVLSVRNRLNIIKQSVLRNEHFAPSTLPSRDRERLVTLKSTKQLLGRAGERFLLLGMLAHNKEGKLCVEDADGSVELDLSKLVSGNSPLRPPLGPDYRNITG